jgi:hypothetical protein
MYIWLCSVFVYYILGGWCALAWIDRQFKLEFVWTVVCEAVFLVPVISDPDVIVDGCRVFCPMPTWWDSVLEWAFMLQLGKSNAGAVFPKPNPSREPPTSPTPPFPTQHTFDQRTPQTLALWQKTTHWRGEAV